VRSEVKKGKRTTFRDLSSEDKGGLMGWMRVNKIAASAGSYLGVGRQPYVTGSDQGVKNRKEGDNADKEWI
jgi:hypothetical protein